MMKNKEIREEVNEEEYKEDKRKDFVSAIRENPWIISTITLGVLCLILLILVLKPQATGNVIKGDDAGENLIEFAKSRGVNLEVVNVLDKGSFYEVVSLMNGEQTSFPVTKDGKYLLSVMIPITGQVVQQTQPQEVEDWSVFENSLPEDLKQTILSFPDSETSQTSNQRVIEFEDYEACENSLIVFYHPGCGWCKRYYPVLVEAKQDYPEFEIYALDMSENGDIADKYGARGTPANIINCKYFASGYMDKEVLYDILDQYS